ncbi:hypothetical protein CXF85_15330 [Colwellia sp. 75C3]|nr:hypothetical protein CXF85_15330 [Colwellia sp. 75C3]
MELLLTLVNFKNMNEWATNIIANVWLLFPKLLTFTLICSFFVNYFGHARYYIYSVLITSFISFVVIPNTPILEHLFLLPMQEIRFVNIFISLFMFLISLQLFMYFTKNITRK